MRTLSVNADDLEKEGMKLETILDDWTLGTPKDADVAVASRVVGLSKKISEDVTHYLRAIEIKKIPYNENCKELKSDVFIYDDEPVQILRRSESES